MLKAEMNGLPLILRTYPCPWPNSWPDPEDSDFRIFVPEPKAAGNRCCLKTSVAGKAMGLEG